MNVVKRNGTIEPFNKDKLSKAVFKALERVSVKDATNVRLAIENVTESLVGAYSPIPTTEVMQLVELHLMKVGLYDLAKEFILYREHNKPDIFRKRVAYKPFEYPQLAEYRLAILNNFWLHTHYSFTSDIQDFKTNMPPDIAEMVKRTVLAISQIEVRVKKFWGNIGSYFPKPEIEEVGAVFAANEVIHAMAYSHLLDILNLNEEFEKLEDVPAIKKRVAYLEKAVVTPVSNKDVYQNIILFSMFIENVSLFSQFYITMKLNKEYGWLKGFTNVTRATQSEEVLHAKFGEDLVNIINAENPTWMSKDVFDKVEELADEALEAERAVIEWITNGNEEFAEEMYEFVKYRMNKGLSNINIPVSYDVNGEDRFAWFDVMINNTPSIDFFAQKSTQYSKGVQTFSEEELF
jgi:ribonucleoside-diphosphate reductase beta chain